jgi:hypothetical protein
MDINLLSFKDGLWVYGSADQHALVDECAALLNWDLHPFDRWLFDSQNWNMYTRRRQVLIASRTDLASAYGKTCEQSARELLIVGYCMSAWKNTRALERKDCPEVRELEFAHVRAKALYKMLKSPVGARRALAHRGTDLGTRLLPNNLSLGNQSNFMN